MLIVVPSAGRAANQVTLRNLHKCGFLQAGKHKLKLVVPAKELPEYVRANSGVSVISTPSNVKGIGATRAWILTELPKKFNQRFICMLDDDMDFYYRPNLSSIKLAGIVKLATVERMFDVQEDWLKQGFAHVGLSARAGNNVESGRQREATRMMNAYSYDTKKLAVSGVILNRLPLMEDFDLTLQLLRKGLPNRVSYEFAWNQRGSGNVGGCSSYRTAELQHQAAHSLAKHHPGFVRVVTKRSKSYWKTMQERTDVIVHWRRAYHSSII